MHARVLIVICVFLATATVAQSRRWFAPEVSCWITQEKVPASWEDAQRRCERHGAVLASPLNMQIYNYLQSRINVHNNSVAYFIGTRAERSDDGQEVSYTSVEGMRLDDMPMAVFDAIDQLDLEQGDCLSMDRHGIRTVSCWDHLPYICYSNETTECGSATGEISTTTSKPITNTAITSTSTQATSTSTQATSTSTQATSTSTQATSTSTLPPPRMIPGYTYYPAKKSYYKFHQEGSNTWDMASATCAREGANLLVVNDAEEVDIVVRILRDTSHKISWTGLRHYRLGGVMYWRTVHGEPLSHVYNVWRAGGPVKESWYACATIHTNDKLLHDVHCSSYEHFICEISQ